MFEIGTLTQRSLPTCGLNLKESLLTKLLSVMIFLSAFSGHCKKFAKDRFQLYCSPHLVRSTACSRGRVTVGQLCCYLPARCRHSSPSVARVTTATTTQDTCDTCSDTSDGARVPGQLASPVMNDSPRAVSRLSPAAAAAP